MNDRIRILIADDHELVRSAIAAVLNDEPDLDVVGEASNGTEAIMRTQLYQPDVIVMDVDMPRVNGVNATRLILGTWPHIRVIGLSVSNREEMESDMWEAGVYAYVPKAAPMTVLLDAIREAAALSG